jgi:hypothetical protein
MQKLKSLFLFIISFVGVHIPIGYHIAIKLEI